jgi:hypothetical protein
MHTVTIALLLAIPLMASAADDATPAASAVLPAPAPPPPRCDGADFRAFDFWLGEWTVTNPDGTPAGTNRISAIEKGCALREEWTSAAGGNGTSLNAFDRRDGRWHQFWVDAQGGVLSLSGKAAPRGMVLEGSTPGPDGQPVRQRITWTARPDGSVTQLWESSADGGSSWTIAFNGTYRRTGGG